jgi:hypothetical protein
MVQIVTWREGDDFGFVGYFADELGFHPSPIDSGLNGPT